MSEKKDGRRARSRSRSSSSSNDEKYKNLTKEERKEKKLKKKKERKGSRSSSSSSSSSDEKNKNLSKEERREKKLKKKKERKRSRSSSSSSSSSDEEYKNLSKEERKRKKKEKKAMKKKQKENNIKQDKNKKNKNARGKENQKYLKATAAAKQTDVKVPSAEEETGGVAKTDAGESKRRENEDDSDTGRKKENKQKKPEESAEASQSGKQKKEYKTEELRRLQEVLRKEKSHIRKPRQRPHFPYVWTSLEPYYNTHTAAFLIDLSVDEQESKTPEPVESPRSPKMTKKRNRLHGEDRQPVPVSRSRTITTPEEFRHSYVSRSTAIGLCDPWVDLEMDNTILPKIGSAQRTSTRGTTHSPERTKEQKKDKEGKDKEKKEKKGSTRLPKFPVVPFHAGKENATMRFPYQDIPKFREEMNQRFSLNAPKKIDNDYKRTKDDFYRMELDKLDEVHPMNRPHMRKAYFAYLQNTPGSRKAVSECVKSLDGSEKQQQHPTGSAQAQEAN